MSQLSTFPVVILLHLVQFLEVEDAISLSMVSREIHDLFLRYERTFWISTLDRTRQNRPLPCPPQVDIIDYDTQTLRGLARHFIRLNRNWRNEKPTIQHVRTLEVDEDLDPLAQIAGTNYVITHCSSKPTLSVWSTEDGKCHCTVQGPDHVFDLSTACSEHDKFTIALLTSCSPNMWPTTIQVVTVDYGGPKVTLEVTYTVQLSDVTRAFRAIFLNEEVVGLLYMDESPSPFHLLAFNRTTNRETDICISLGAYMTEDDYGAVCDADSLGTAFWNGNLYIHNESDAYTTHGWIPRNLLPYTDNIDVAARTFCALDFIPPRSASSDRNLCTLMNGILTMNASSGVLAATVYTPDPNVYPTADGPSTGVDLWVIDSTSRAEAEESGQLPMPTGCPPIILPGKIRTEHPSTWCPYQASTSGIYLVLILQNEDESLVVNVVHLKLPDHRFTVHTLDLPPMVTPELISGFSIDEYRGVITLHVKKGKMYVMEYA